MYDYTRQDMIDALRAVGLERGDEVLFYVSLAMLGLGEGVTSQDAMNGLFLDCAREVLGPEGTMFVPTYSYSLCRGEVYDSASTPGTIGPFPEFFRTQSGVIRSEEPILAVCAQGPAAEEVFRDLPPTSYGHGCVYDRLARRKAKICCVGLRLNWATFRHFIEEICDVPFRYRKVFTGPVLKDGREQVVDWVYSVRLWGGNADPDGVPLADMTVADGVTRTVDLGRNTLFCIDADRYVEYASEKLRENPWLSAAGPAADPLALEEERVPVVRFDAALARDASLSDVARKLAPLPREIMSDAYNQALAALADRHGFSVTGYPSGAEGVGCIVPEKWTCREATLSDASGKVIFDLGQSPLRIAAFSVGFSGEADGDTVRERCVVGDGAPGQVAYASTGRDRVWAFSCSREEAARLTDASYQVDVKVDFSYGNLNVGEWLTGEEGSRPVTLVTFLDGPCQFDSGLSGVLAGCRVMDRIASEKPGLSVRLLVLPREYGLPVWVRQNPEKAGDARSYVVLDRLARGGEVVKVEAAGTPESVAAASVGVPAFMVSGTTDYPVEGTTGDVFTEDGSANIERAADRIMELLGEL